MIKRVVIRAPNWIGDSVLSISAVKSIINKGYKTSIFCKKLHKQLFSGIAGIEEVIEMPDDNSKILRVLKRSRLLRRYDFDAILILSPSFSSALEAFLAGIPIRIGHSYDARGFLLTHSTPFNQKKSDNVHVDMKGLLSFLDIKHDDIVDDFAIPISTEIDKKARRFVDNLKRPIFAINPSASFGPTKIWFSDRYAAVANRLLREFGGTLLLLGGPDDQVICDRVYSMIDKSLMKSTKRLYGKDALSLIELAALVKRIDLFITNDTGPMHIAAAQGSPCVVIFGATKASYQFPYKTKSKLLEEKDLDCRPCYKKRCKNNYKCLDLIDTDMVYSACKELLT